MEESTTEGPEWQRPVKNDQAKEEKKGLKKKVKSQDRSKVVSRERIQVF